MKNKTNISFAINISLAILMLTHMLWSMNTITNIRESIEIQVEEQILSFFSDYDIIIEE